MSNYHSFVAGIGKTLGQQQTLLEFEKELQEVRDMGAPDDAIVSRAIPGSTYAIECVWRGESGRMDEKSEKDHWTIDPYGKGVAWIHTCTDGEVWVFPPVTKTCARCGVERPQTPGYSKG